MGDLQARPAHMREWSALITCGRLAIRGERHAACVESSALSMPGSAHSRFWTSRDSSRRGARPRYA